MMKKILTALLVGMALCMPSYAQNPTDDQDPLTPAIRIEPINQARVDEIAAMLPDEPKGYGVPFSDRKAWQSLLASGKCDLIIKTADDFLKEPFPPMTEEIYMTFFKGKDSETSKRLTVKRRIILSTYVWAECLTGMGKYLPAIDQALNDLLAAKSWNFPAEDRQLTNYNGTQYTLGLSSADYASEIAQILYLLGDKLKPEVQSLAMTLLYQRVFEPVLQGIKTKNKNGEFRSLTSTGNHNEVELSGVTNAAFTVIKDKKERAVFAAIAERYSKNSIAGFTADGYCSEGVAYYNYGISHYILLRETLWQATKGKIDLLDNPKIKKIGGFLPRMEIMNDIYPAIGDCLADTKPNKTLLYYLNRNLNLGLKKYETLAPPANAPLINLMYFFPNSASQASTPAATAPAEGIRSYFDVAGVLTVRPVADSLCKMGATIKGGNNHEHHNHNDVGSFSIVLDNEMVMGDAGLATYTPKTFSAERYTTFKTIASYGHPVPLVAGIQQHEGADAKAVITSTSFKNEEDKLTMDLTTAYTVKGLTKLIRNFTYNRSRSGFLDVTDEVEFTTPQLYETALITRAAWKQTSDNTIELTKGNQTLVVVIATPGSGFSVIPETITECPLPYTRLGIRLKEPLQKGAVKMTFKPKR
jgi:hypothetical protein